MPGINIKTPEELAIMSEGGKRLARIRNLVVAAIKPGITTLQLDRMAGELIREAGGEPSFKMVPGYRHTTCICINEEVVHGIPGDREIQKEDKVSLDVGMVYRGFHTDTAATVMANGSNTGFLDTGRAALKKAIGQARAGKTVADISRAMQEVIEKAGYSPVRSLTGHGVGRQLHEEPMIPCFDLGVKENSPQLSPGMVLAIEVMYNEGSYGVTYKNNDGWTIATADGKISGLFEHTVAVTRDNPVVLTEAKNE